MRSNKSLNVLPALALVALVLPLPLAADGGECPLDQPATPQQTETAALPESTAGMRVVIDPETGALRAPTAKESAVLFGIPEGQPPTKSEAQEPAIERPDGSLLLQFRGSFLKAAVATVGDDGQVAVEYHGSSVPMPAHRIVNPPAAAAPQATETTTEEKE